MTTMAGSRGQGEQWQSHGQGEVMARRARISPWRISEEGIEKVGNAIRVAREDVPEFVTMGKEKFVPMGKENLTGKKRNLSAFQAECALEREWEWMINVVKSFRRQYREQLEKKWLAAGGNERPKHKYERYMMNDHDLKNEWRKKPAWFEPCYRYLVDRCSSHNELTVRQFLRSCLR